MCRQDKKTSLVTLKKLFESQIKKCSCFRSEDRSVECLDICRPMWRASTGLRFLIADCTSVTVNPVTSDLLTSVTPVREKHIWGPWRRECWHGHESDTVDLSQPSATAMAPVTVPSITPPATFLQLNRCDIQWTPPSVQPLWHVSSLCVLSTFS